MNDKNDNKKSQKKTQIYRCEKCQYITLNKKDYTKHLGTRKHSMITEKSQKIPTPFICSNCGKTYKFLSGLSRHRKTCTENFENSSENFTNFSEIFQNNQNSNNQNLDFKTAFIQLLNKTTELQDTIIKQQDKHNEEINNILPKIGNYNNNKFNINFFLNEECKDAINIMDFVQSLQHQIKDLENTGKLGYVDGITNVFLRGLKELDINKRPIHCSDIKKEILYVKDNDQWGKDNDEIKMKKAIDFISKSHIKQIPDWVEENNNKSEDNETYYQILKEAVNYNDENVGKIIKNISKNVIIDNDEDTSK